MSLIRSLSSSNGCEESASHLEQLESRQLLTAYVVDITADENDGVGVGTGTSLREAIEAANSGAGSDSITFDAGVFAGSNTITLGGSQLLISDDLTITGAAGQEITVDGDSLSRVLEVSSGTVTLSGVDFTGGDSGVGDGGGIFNSGDLTIKDATISGNTASSGNGGGIYNSGTLTIETAVVDNNQTGIAFYGGGIYNTGSLTVTGTTVSNNNAKYGAGVLNLGGTVDMTESTVNNNSSTGVGGGIMASIGTFNITNSTISRNQTTFAGAGGGIVASGNLNMTNVTVVKNLANSTIGGGIWITGGTTNMHNSIVAGNKSTSGDDDIAGSVSFGTHNLVGDSGSSGGLTDGVDGNIVGNSGVGVLNVHSVLNTTLKDLGGPTKMHELIAGSAALDTGDDVMAIAEGLTTDQRGSGFTRFFGTVDIGAYEANQSTIFVDNAVDEDDGDHTVGDLSFREAIGLANANPLIDTIEISNLASIELDASVIYTGTQDLTIEGAGVSINTVAGKEGVFDLFVSESAANLTIQNATFEEGASGIVVNVPLLSTGTIALALVNVLVQDNYKFGVHMNDKLFHTDAGLQFLSFASQFVLNGHNAATTYDGVRIDDGGIGDVRADIYNSAFIQNGGDGLELDEVSDGQAVAIVSDSFFYQNGYDDPAAPDDGLDVDERDLGGVFVEVTNTQFENHADQGIDIGEDGLGSAAVILTDVESNFNLGDNVKIEEDVDGDLIVSLTRVITNLSAGGAGINLAESGLGSLEVTGADIMSDGNFTAGIVMNEFGAGDLRAILQRVSTQFNGADGFTAKEHDHGDMLGAMIDLTTVGNGAFGVNLFQMTMPGDIGHFTLYYLAFANTLGPITSNVVVVP